MSPKLIAARNALETNSMLTSGAWGFVKNKALAQTLFYNISQSTGTNIATAVKSQTKFKTTYTYAHAEFGTPVDPRTDHLDADGTEFPINERGPIGYPPRRHIDISHNFNCNCKWNTKLGGKGDSFLVSNERFENGISSVVVPGMQVDKVIYKKSIGL